MSNIFRIATQAFGYSSYPAPLQEGGGAKRRGENAPNPLSTLAKPARRAGFTLVEISMVMLLFASAIGGLLSFFPVGLSLETNAISDSAQTMFALNLLGQIEANANKITDWKTWKDDDKFWNAILGSGDSKLKLEPVKVDDGKYLISKSMKKSHLRYGSSNDDYMLRSVDSDDDGETIGESSGYLTKSGQITYILQMSFFDTPFYDEDKHIRRIALWVTDRRDGDPKMSKPFTLDLVFHPSLEKIFPQGS